MVTRHLELVNPASRCNCGNTVAKIVKLVSNCNTVQYTTTYDNILQHTLLHYEILACEAWPALTSTDQLLRGRAFGLISQQAVSHGMFNEMSHA